MKFRHKGQIRLLKSFSGSTSCFEPLTNFSSNIIFFIIISFLSRSMTALLQFLYLVYNSPSSSIFFIFPDCAFLVSSIKVKNSLFVRNPRASCKNALRTSPLWLPWVMRFYINGISYPSKCFCLIPHLISFIKIGSPFSRINSYLELCSIGSQLLSDESETTISSTFSSILAFLQESKIQEKNPLLEGAFLAFANLFNFGFLDDI